MALHRSRKLKISKGNILFNVDWELEFFFVQDRDKNICLKCRDTVDYNTRGKRHYNTKHGEDFTSIVGEARQIKLDQMKKTLTTEQSIFKKVDTSRKSLTGASYAISNIIAKRMKPFTDCEYLIYSNSSRGDYLFRGLFSPKILCQFLRKSIFRRI